MKVSEITFDSKFVFMQHTRSVKVGNFYAWLNPAILLIKESV